MKACISLLALTLGLASIAACSSGDTTTTTGTSSAGGMSSSSAATTTTGGTGGAGGSASATTGAGGASGGATSSASSSSTASATSSGSGGMAAFSLTSTGITEGMAISTKYACAPGTNVSPDLSWTAGPIGTLSYAVVLTDKSNNYTHWVIWDISNTTTSLPEGVEKKANPAIPVGSKQAKSYNNQTFGYLGPCPPSTHTYEFAVFALDVATLPNVTTASNRDVVKQEILNHDLASATLTGTYTP